MKRINDNLKRLTSLQVSLSTLAAILFLLINKANFALSAFLGGMVAVIPARLFAWCLFRHQGARAARQIFQSLFWGVMWKWLLTILLCVTLFKLIRIIPEVFFLTYGMILLTHWAAPLFLNKLK